MSLVNPSTGLIITDFSRISRDIEQINDQDLDRLLGELHVQLEMGISVAAKRRRFRVEIGLQAQAA